MESEKFDELIKRVGTARVSRLTALRGLAGGALAALAGVAVATETEAGKGRKSSKKRKSKKKSRNSVAPTYDSPPVYKPVEKTTTTSTTAAPTCPKDKYEDCGYDADWDDKDCRCVCKKNNHDYCRSDYDPYLYGTCVDKDCPEYTSYDDSTCKCKEVCYPKTCEELGYDCGDHKDNCGNDIHCGACCEPKTCHDQGYECGNWDDTCGTPIDCGDCKGKDYYDNGYCDADGKCACDAYTRDDCSYLYDSYAEACSYDPYGDYEAKDGCGGKVTCPCKGDRA
jgi:hypothetical protein